jgi:hypothetical protein
MDFSKIRLIRLTVEHVPWFASRVLQPFSNVLLELLPALAIFVAAAMLLWHIGNSARMQL